MKKNDHKRELSACSRLAWVVDVFAELHRADSKLLLKGFGKVGQILETALAGDVGE